MAFFTSLKALVLGLTTMVVFAPAASAATIDPGTQHAEVKKITTKDPYGLALQVKGGKLSLKEKVALLVLKRKMSKADGKSQVVALILALVVGGLGIHRFYLGYTWQGIVQLLTFGGLGVWALIDLIRIAIGDLKPKNGEYEKTL